MREYVVENEFVKAVRAAGGVAYKLNSLTTNGLPDRLVLFPDGKALFVELKAPGKQMRPLQVKRRYQLQRLGFPVICIDRFSQITPAIQAIMNWSPGEEFPAGIGAKVPELMVSTLPAEELADYGDTLEPEDPAVLAEFEDLDNASPATNGGTFPAASGTAVPATNGGTAPVASGTVVPATVGGRAAAVTPPATNGGTDAPATMGRTAAGITASVKANKGTGDAQ